MRPQLILNGPCARPSNGARADPVTAAEFRAAFPAFADLVAYSDTYLDLIIQQAARRISSVYFGELYEDALGYLTAHLLATFTAAGLAVATGGLTPSSVTAGPVSVSYSGAAAGGNTAGRGLYSGTAYGLEFERILRSVVPGIMVP